ncbi:hypothetical protein AVEN_262268-1 [Araneus ventricosus]|uniref:Uncharacterized protein n=1 Tax=Araneus ventricosus TaxID=182803 RepID=A0A4Y2P4L3_ARAVE|nr:hypothetical protein AVEN_262268-1 [Araneus ventricosus]
MALVKATVLLYNVSEIKRMAEFLRPEQEPDKWHDLIEAKVSALRLPKVLHEKLITVAEDACEFLGFFFKTHTMLQRYRDYNVRCDCLNGIVLSRYLRTDPEGFLDGAKTIELIARDRRIDSLFRYLLVRINDLDTSILEPPMNEPDYEDDRFLRWVQGAYRVKGVYPQVEYVYFPHSPQSE